MLDRVRCAATLCRGASHRPHCAVLPQPLGAWGLCHLHSLTTHSVHGGALQHMAAAQGLVQMHGYYLITMHGSMRMFT